MAWPPGTETSWFPVSLDSWVFTRGGGVVGYTYQSTTVAGESGHIPARAGSDLGDGLGAVGGRLAAEVEVGTGGVHGEQVHGRSRASGNHSEGFVGALGVAIVREGKGQGKDGEDGSELHFDWLTRVVVLNESVVGIIYYQCNSD